MEWYGFSSSSINHIPTGTAGSLYLGPWTDSGREHIVTLALKKRKIGFIVGLGFSHHPIEHIVDSPMRHIYTLTDIMPDLDGADEVMCEFLRANLCLIHSALLAGVNVYVHCHTGISRAPSVVIAYLMEYQGFTYPGAYAHVKKYRPQIRPNSGFRRLLASWPVVRT